MFNNVSQDGIDLTFLGKKKKRETLLTSEKHMTSPPFFFFVRLSHCKVSAGELHPDFSTVDVILK